MQMTCLVKLFSVYLHDHFMFAPSVCAPGLLGQLSSNACTAMCLSTVQANNYEQVTLKMRKQISSLVFIFIFYISLNVQRVSCYTVNYLYIHLFNHFGL